MDCTQSVLQWIVCTNCMRIVCVYIVDEFVVLWPVMSLDVDRVVSYDCVADVLCLCAIQEATENNRINQQRVAK